MLDLTEQHPPSEAQFRDLVDALARPPAQQEALIDLLQENHALYNQQSTAAIVRMRGWVLLALARTGVPDRALPFLLEEFHTGTDSYLIAAAARALRSYERPSAALTPFVVEALRNVQDEPVSFASYGEYATSSRGTSAVRELLALLAWLGPHARSALPALTTMREQPGKFSKKLQRELDRTVAGIVSGKPVDENQVDPCCALPSRLGQRWWSHQERERGESVDSIVFEDQDGGTVRFHEFFSNKPSIVVFFYTRCDNPWKCSLTVTKLARVQRLLMAQGLFGKIQTAAISYDSGFDLPNRLRGYGEDRGVLFDTHNRMLRTTEGFATLSRHFELGVNFIESLVNRHRIELYILDSAGRIAARFERVHWDESMVVDCANEVLREQAAPTPAPSRYAPCQTAAPMVGALASLAWAFFPKCPMCWAACLSAAGMAGIAPTLDLSKVKPVLAALILLNLGSVWLRTRATRERLGWYLVCMGTLAMILAWRMDGWKKLEAGGVALTFLGSLSCVTSRTELHLFLDQIWMQLRRYALCRHGRLRTILRLAPAKDRLLH